MMKNFTRQLLFIPFTILAVQSATAMQPASTKIIHLVRLLHGTTQHILIAEPNTSQETPSNAASLHRLTPEIDQYGKTLLIRAAAGDNTALCKLILNSDDAAIDWQDTFGNTALHVAAQEGHVEICKLLIDAGAPINGKNRNGQTPLLCAARIKDTIGVRKSPANKAQIYEMLMDHKADIQPKDSDGRTALQLVFHNGLDQELLKNRIKILLLTLNRLRSDGDACARLLYRHFRVLLLPPIQSENEQRKKAELDAFEQEQREKAQRYEVRPFNPMIAFA